MKNWWFLEDDENINEEEEDIEAGDEENFKSSSDELNSEGDEEDFIEINDLEQDIDTQETLDGHMMRWSILKWTSFFRSNDFERSYVLGRYYVFTFLYFSSFIVWWRWNYSKSIFRNLKHRSYYYMPYYN